MADSKKTDDDKPIGIVGWSGRAFLVVAVGFGLYFAPAAVDVERLSWVVTILVPAVGVYALFDRRLLEVIIREVRKVWERVRARAQKKPTVAPHAAATTIAAAEVPTPTAAVSKPERRTAPTLFDWALLIATPIVTLLALIFWLPPTLMAIISIAWPPEGPTVPDVLPEPADIVADGEPPTGPEELVAPPARPTLHTVTRGDSCATIARLYCTESKWPDFQRLNAIAMRTVNNRPQCVLEIGKAYALPTAWKDVDCDVKFSAAPSP